MRYKNLKFYLTTNSPHYKTPIKSTKITHLHSDTKITYKNATKKTFVFLRKSLIQSYHNHKQISIKSLLFIRPSCNNSHIHNFHIFCIIICNIFPIICPFLYRIFEIVSIRIPLNKPIKVIAYLHTA